MGFDEPDFTDNDDAGGGNPLSSSNASCSICLELVIFDDGRSCVKLICGHEFHLDCIGSAFNSRGAMQCPNCRNTEKGQWLYASGGPACDDPHDEEFYDLSYSEMSVGVRWCPFMLSQLSSSFEDGEFPSSAYHDLLGHQTLYAEHASSVSSTNNNPCPYFSYYGPVHSPSPNTGPSVSDNSFSNHWSGLLASGLSEMPTPYNLPSMDPHYHGWEHHSSPLSVVSNRLGNADQPSVPSITQRSARPNSDVARPGYFMHPFLVGHSSNTRASNNIPSSMVPPYPGTAARTRDHIQSLQAHFQAPNSSPPGRSPLLSATRHSSSHRNSSPLASSSDQTGHYIFPNAHNRNFPEAENQMPRSFHAWEREQRLASLFPPLNQVEREPGWGTFPTTSFHQQRHGSDRTQSSQAAMAEEWDSGYFDLPYNDFKIRLAYSVK